MEQKEKLYSIYVHTNKINNKKYIGQSCIPLEKRWNKGEGYQRCPYFYRAIKKYGWDNFIHEVLKDGLSKEQADYWETFYIKEFKTLNPDFGYNLTLGGEGSVGRVLSDESKRKMSNSQKKRFTSQEERDKISKANSGEKGYWFGKNLPDEIKQKISKANKGKHFNDESKQKLSNSLKGRKLSEETKQKMKAGRQGENAHMYGKHHSEESKKKMSEKHKGKNCGEDNINSCKVRCIETNEIFDSMASAAKSVGLKSYTNISQCCHGKREKAKGYHWEFIK